MRHHVMTLLASGALLSSSLTGSAAAADPMGLLCGYSSMTSPTDGWQHAAIDAGPLTLTGSTDPSAVYWGSVTCTIQLEPQHGTTANDSAALTSAVTPGVVALAGTASYRAEPWDSVYLCTQVDVVDGPTLYFDEEQGAWSTSSATRCAGLIGDPQEPFDPVGEFVDAYAGQAVCPVLAVVLPPDGDVPGVWECPPYGT